MVIKMSTNQRKLDTRNKIQMGSLIVKAKLDYLHEDHKDVLLGILIDAANKLSNSNEESHYFNYYKTLGQENFKD